MNPDNVKQFNNLLWMGVKKNKRDSIRGMVSTRYVNPEMTVLLELRRGGTPPQVQFLGETVKDELRCPKFTDLGSQVVMSTALLREIVDNITSDSVTLEIWDGFAPLRLIWKDKEDEWMGLIMPRIKNE